MTSAAARPGPDRTGRSMRSGRRAAQSQCGFAYMLLLIAVAVIGVAAASALSVGSTMARRDAEQQLLAIGEEFQRALSSYAGISSGEVAPALTPAPGIAAGSPASGVPLAPSGASGPRTLDDLLRDSRVPQVRKHLRQIYADPLTGKAEWGLVRDNQGFIVGIYSLADGRPIKRTGWPAQWAHFEEQKSYAGWVFGARRGVANLPTQR